MLYSAYSTLPNMLLHFHGNHSKGKKKKRNDAICTEMFVIGATPLRNKTAIKQLPYAAMEKTQSVARSLTHSTVSLQTKN